MEVWSWPLSWSTRVNRDKNRKCCSPSFRLSQVHQDTPCRGNSQRLWCFWTIHHWKTCTCNWTEMLFLSDPEQRLKFPFVWRLENLEQFVSIGTPTIGSKTFTYRKNILLLELLLRNRVFFHKPHKIWYFVILYHIVVSAIWVVNLIRSRCVIEQFDGVFVLLTFKNIFMFVLGL